MLSDRKKLENELQNAREALTIKEHQEEIGCYGSSTDYLALAKEHCIDTEYFYFNDWEIDSLEAHIERIENDISLLKSREEND